MKKILFPLVMLGAFFTACSLDSLSDSKADEPHIALKKESMWYALQRMGIPEYFDSLSQEGVIPAWAVTSSFSVKSCPAPALKMDDNTRYLDELESVFQEGKLVDGVCGKALSLNDGEVAPLGVNLIDSMKVGTMEFWFRPGDDFYDDSARTILGNDGARIHFFYKDGNLIFQKNHADIHYFVEGPVQFKDGWNLIAGQWGDGYMSLWLNGEMVARKEHSLGYVPAMRNKPFENLLVIGFKSYCCMEGPGQYEGMKTSGAFDQFRISNIPRYKMEETPESSSSIELSESSSSWGSSNSIELPKSSDSQESSSSLEWSASSASSDTGTTLWNLFNYYGVSSYFGNKTLPQVSTFVPNRCADSVLAVDEQTVFFDELETVYQEGKLVDGVCGNALLLADGEVAPLGINMDSAMSAGTVEFWFRPGEDFYEKTARTLLGNDGSRIQFLYANGKLIFQKNLTNRHVYVQGEVSLDDGWNLIAGQWGDGSMSLWLNGEKVADIAHSDGYAPTDRGNTLDNLIVVGFKSSCCMEGPGVSGPLTTSGAYDQLRVSSVPRY